MMVQMTIRMTVMFFSVQ